MRREEGPSVWEKDELVTSTFRSGVVAHIHVQTVDITTGALRLVYPAVVIGRGNLAPGHIVFPL